MGVIQITWEIVKDVKAFRRSPKPPLVEVTRTGRIRLNSKATEQLQDEVFKGRNQAIILFNPVTKRIGVVPIDEEQAQAFRMDTSRERVRIFKVRRTKKGITVSAKHMFEKLGLPLPVDQIVTAEPTVEEHPEFGKILVFSTDELQKQAERIQQQDEGEVQQTIKAPVLTTRRKRG